MAQKHKIEIFSAECATCKETIDMVRKIAGSDHEVQIHRYAPGRNRDSREATRRPQPAGCRDRRQAGRMLRGTRP